MQPLYLTNNRNLCSTARILQSWLQLGREKGKPGAVVGQHKGELTDWLDEQGIPNRINPMPWPDRRKPWNSAWHAIRIAGWARTHAVDVIHCNEHDVYPFATVLKRFLNRPVVCHIRYRLDRGFAEWAFGGSRAPDALLWTSHQQKADSADAISGLVAEDRQHVVRLGVTVKEMEAYRLDGPQLRQRWSIRDNEILIGLPSPLRPRKRIQDFVELIRRLALRHSNVVGIIAGQEVPGNEDYRAHIEQQIENTGLGRRLRWVGYLSPIEPFHHACDISVSTSEYETFGNSICEAMACGKPVAACRGGSVAEVVGDTGLLVKAGDLDGLTSAVEQLAISSETRSGLGAQARQRVLAEFDPDNSLNQIEAIYASIMRATSKSMQAASVGGEL